MLLVILHHPIFTPYLALPGCARGRRGRVEDVALYDGMLGADAWAQGKPMSWKGRITRVIWNGGACLWAANGVMGRNTKGGCCSGEAAEVRRNSQVR